MTTPEPLYVPRAEGTRRRPRVGLLVGVATLLVAVLTLAVISLWFPVVRAAVTGGERMGPLRPGDAVELQGTGYTVSVPDRWSGWSAEYMRVPEWTGGDLWAPSSNGARQVVTLSSKDDHRFAAMLFVDEGAWDDVRAGWSRDAEPVGLAGTEFVATGWVGYSEQTTSTARICVFGPSAQENEWVLVGLISQGEETTDSLFAQLSALVSGH